MHGEYTTSLGLHTFMKHWRRKKLKVPRGPTRAFIPLWEYSSEELALVYMTEELHYAIRKVFSTKAIHTVWHVINVLISVEDESSAVSHGTYSFQHSVKVTSWYIVSLAWVIAKELLKLFPVSKWVNVSIALCDPWRRMSFLSKVFSSVLFPSESVAPVRHAATAYYHTLTIQCFQRRNTCAASPPLTLFEWISLR